MRKLCMIGVSMAFLTLFVGTGCTDKKPVVTDSIISDSLSADTLPIDSLEALLEEQPMPKAADELFDDFIFNFASNRRLQKERVVFPLSFDDHGSVRMIQKQEWQYERFFMQQEYYTLVFNSRSQMDIVKDTTVSSVTIERIVFADNVLTQWIFNREEGLWKLKQMRNSPIAKHPDAAFLNFYEKFATDTTFQTQSLAELVQVSAPDPEDDFARMEGEVMPEQWPMFAPWLPSGTLYNIHYGAADYKPSASRIFVIRGIANGLETELSFARKDDDCWQLVKLEN